MNRYAVPALALGFVLLCLSAVLPPSAKGAPSFFSYCYGAKSCVGYYNDIDGDKCVYSGGNFRECGFALTTKCSDNAGYPCSGVLENAGQPCLISVAGCDGK